MNYDLYEGIMKNECEMYDRIRVPSWINFNRSRGEITYRPEDFYMLAQRVLEFAKSSFVPRGYNEPYGLSSADFFFESVGGHTNLVSEITSSALDFTYSENFGNSFALSSFMTRTIDGYSYREVLEVARLHDLAENETGDSPDHGNRDEDLKMAMEFDYVERHLGTYPDSQRGFTERVLRLFSEMQMLTSPTGILLYLADKVAALIVTLALDLAERERVREVERILAEEKEVPPELLKPRSPMISGDDPYLTEQDIREIRTCDKSFNGKYRASEMWTIDYFVTREISKLDKDMFFTALIVATTLVVNDVWYGWREMDYLTRKPSKK